MDNYLGPYLRAIETRTTEITDCCVDHNFPENALYCPKCGTHKNKRTTTKSVKKNMPPREYKKDGVDCYLYDYLYSPVTIEETDDLVAVIYLPNRFYKEIGIPELDMENDEGRHLSPRRHEMSLEDINIPVMKNKFAEYFKDEIAHIRQYNTAEVKFGYITYYS